MYALDDGLHVQIDDFVSKEMGKLMVTKNSKETDLQVLGMDISDQGGVVSSKGTAAEVLFYASIYALNLSPLISLYSIYNITGTRTVRFG